jgi:DNA-binding transcriptional ArsR family regulator
MEKIPNPLDVDKAADLLMALSNSKRLEILLLLIREEMAVGKLAEAVGLGQSALSQHLAKLRLAKLVTTRRDAQSIYYSSKSAEVMRILQVLGEIYVTEMPDQATAS